MHVPRIVLSTFLGIGFLLTASWAVEHPPATPTVMLEGTLHFLPPDGSDVVVEPGTYAIESADAWLRLVKGARTDAVLVQAEVITHKETLGLPMGLFIVGEENVRHLVLLLPDGRGMDAVGSTTGVRSRVATGYQVLGAPQISQALKSCLAEGGGLMCGTAKQALAARYLRFKYALIPATPANLQAARAVRNYDELRQLAGSQHCQFVGAVAAPNHGVQVIYLPSPSGNLPKAISFDIVGTVPAACATGPAQWARELRWMLVTFEQDLDVGRWEVTPRFFDSQTVQFRSDGSVRYPAGVLPQDFRVCCRSAIDRIGGTYWSYLNNVAIGVARGAELSGTFGLIGRGYIVNTPTDWLLVGFDGEFRLNNIAVRNLAECGTTAFSCYAVGAGN